MNSAIVDDTVSTTTAAASSSSKGKNKRKSSGASNDAFEGKNYLYLIGHAQPKITPYTHINCSDDPEADLQRHNNTLPGEGVRETKKAAGHWRLLLSIYVPPTRQIDIQRLMEHWRAEHRTVPHRLAFGVQMAAQLMLICFVNEDVLQMPEMKSKLPPDILEKIAAKLRNNRSSSSTAAVAQTHNNDDDDDEESDSDSSSDNDDNSTTIQTALKRYIENPDAVFRNRHPGNLLASPQSIAEAKHFSKEFLDRLNTLYPIDIVTTAAAAAASTKKSSLNADVKKHSVSLLRSATAGEAICFTKKSQPDHQQQQQQQQPQSQQSTTTTIVEPQQVAVQKKPRPPRSSNTRAARRATKFLHSKLIQTGALSPAAVEATTLSNDAQRKRKSMSLTSKLAAIHRDAFESATAFADKTLLRRYGDLLCDNIADQSMRAKTKTTSGESTSRCLCGTYRSPDASPVPVVIKAGEPAVMSFVCSTCNRFSVAYEKISLDMEKFSSGGGSSFEQQQQKKPSPTKRAASSSSTNAGGIGEVMDQFLESLIVSFRDTAPSKSGIAATSNPTVNTTTNKRRRLLDADSADTATTAASTATTMVALSANQQSSHIELQTRLVDLRKKMTGTLLPQSDSNDPLIKTMFGE